MSRRSSPVHWLIPLLCALGLAAVFPLRSLADDEAPSGKRYALLVGVRKYRKDELRRLEYAENDVNDLAQLLKAAGYRRVILMTQSEAAATGNDEVLPTAENIRIQLKSLLEDRKPEDTVLVAFSGHGVQPRDHKEHYFCPMDAQVNDPKTMVPLTEVYDQLGACKAGAKVLLADCCRNDPRAGLDKGAGMALESVTRPQAEPTPGGVAALFSCSEGEKSYESDRLRHGVFFHFVIEGLKGKAANRRGEVTLEHLAAYVKDEVPDQVKDDIGATARQLPHLVGDLSGSAALVKVDGGGQSDTKTAGEKPEKILPPPSTISIPASPPDDPVWRRLGLRLQIATADELKHTGDVELHGGLMVSEVREASPAYQAGIQFGDVLIGLNVWEMLNKDNVLFVLNHPDLATFNPVKFYILRNGLVRRGTVKVD